MTISVRLNDEDTKLFQRYAKQNGISISELIRRAVIEHIEDEYDLALYKKAIEEFEKDPVTYSHEEVWKLLEEDK